MTDREPTASFWLTVALFAVLVRKKGTVKFHTRPFEAVAFRQLTPDTDRDSYDPLRPFGNAMYQILHSVLLAVLVSGCGGGNVESIQKFDGITVTVRLPPGKAVESVGRSADGVHTWKAGDQEYVVDHMKLSVNGNAYGTVKTGDQVLIEGGKVNINDAERKAE